MLQFICHETNAVIAFLVLGAGGQPSCIMDGLTNCCSVVFCHAEKITTVHLFQWCNNVASKEVDTIWLEEYYLSIIYFSVQIVSTSLFATLLVNLLPNFGWNKRVSLKKVFTFRWPYFFHPPQSWKLGLKVGMICEIGRSNKIKCCPPGGSKITRRSSSRVKIANYSSKYLP